MKSDFEFKKKINNKGFYARIELEVVATDDSGIRLVYDHNTKWYPAVKFACEYLYETSLRQKGKGFQIKVNELNTQLIDTSSVVVVYATIKAVYKALEIVDDTVVINEEGSLVLPK